jgi:hypothetical protein
MVCLFFRGTHHSGIAKRLQLKHRALPRVRQIPESFCIRVKSCVSGREWMPDGAALGFDP